MSGHVTLATHTQSAESTSAFNFDCLGVSNFKYRYPTTCRYGKTRVTTDVSSAGYAKQSNPILVRKGDYLGRLTVVADVPPLDVYPPNSNITPYFVDDAAIAIFREFRLKAGNETISECNGMTMLLRSQRAAHVSQRIDEDIGQYFDDIQGSAMSVTTQEFLIDVDMTPFRHGQLHSALPMFRMKSTVPTLNFSTRAFSDVTEFNASTPGDIDRYRVVQAGGRSSSDVPRLNVRLVGEYYLVTDAERASRERGTDHYLYYVPEIMEENNVMLNRSEVTKVFQVQPSGMIRGIDVLVQPRNASDTHLYKIGKDFHNFGSSFNASGEPILRATTKIDNHELEDIDVTVGTRIFHKQQGTLRGNRNGFFALYNQSTNVNYQGPDGGMHAGSVDAIRTALTFQGPTNGACSLECNVWFVTERYQLVVAHGTGLFVYVPGQQM